MMPRQNGKSVHHLSGDMPTTTIKKIQIRVHNQYYPQRWNPTCERDAVGPR